MSKIIIFSDLHIYAHKHSQHSFQRLQDCLDVLRWVFQTALDRNVKNVLFLGDLFHDRQKIQVLAYHNTFEIFKEYRDLDIELLLGNHDLWFYDKWDVNSVVPLGALSNVQVIDKPCTKNIAGIDIDFLPFTHDPITVISQNLSAKSPILCGHIAIDDSTLNSLYNTKSEVSIESDKDVVCVNKDVLKGWKKVFLGHYHCAQKLGWIEYVGSPLQLNFSEAFQKKHIILFDTETFECEYIENTFSPKHLILRYDEVATSDLNNSFVKIQVDNIESSDIIDMRKSIMETATVQSLEFKELKRIDIDKPRDELQNKFDISNGDFLERYISAIGYGELEYSKLLRIGKDICNEN